MKIIRLLALGASAGFVIFLLGAVLFFGVFGLS